MNLAKAEPLHNTNNAWQQWFSALLTMAMQYTDQAKLHTATVVLDLPNSSPLVTFLKCVWETVKCGRPCNSLNRWFSGKRKKGISFSYRFTGLESKRFFFFQGTLANRKIFKRVCFKTALLGGVSSSVWTLGYAITYHINQLFNKLGFRLGLNSMQG